MNLNKLKGKKVLLVEDDDVNQFLVKKILKDMHIVLTIANNGLEAMDQVKKESFDAILMDIEMPVVDGIGTTQQIRALTDTNKSHVPVIGLSANPFETNGEKYIAQGMNDFMSKPINETELLSKLSHHIL